MAYGDKNCTCSRVYLTLLNSIVFVVSIVIISITSIIYRDFSSIEAGIEKGTIIAPLVAGILLLLVSLLGLYAVSCNNDRGVKIHRAPPHSCALIVYTVLTANITLVVLACGIALLTYAKFISHVRHTDLDVEDTSGFKQELKIQDFELAVFHECCTVGFNATDVKGCDETEGVTSVCVTDWERFERLTEEIGDPTCSLLESIDIEGVPIVGDPDLGGCGDGRPPVFVRRLAAYLEDNIKRVGIVCICLAVLLVLDLFASCGVLYKDKSRYVTRSRDHSTTVTTSAHDREVGLGSNSGKKLSVDPDTLAVAKNESLTGQELREGVAAGPAVATEEEIEAPVILHTLHLPGEEHDAKVIQSDDV